MSTIIVGTSCKKTSFLVQSINELQSHCNSMWLWKLMYNLNEVVNLL